MTAKKEVGNSGIAEGKMDENQGKNGGGGRKNRKKWGYVNDFN